MDNQFANALHYIMVLLQRKDTNYLRPPGETDQLLQDQFLLGLRNIPQRHILREKVDANPTLTFYQLQKEAVQQGREKNKQK